MKKNNKVLVFMAAIALVAAGAFLLQAGIWKDRTGMDQKVSVTEEAVRQEVEMPVYAAESAEGIQQEEKKRTEDVSLSDVKLINESKDSSLPAGAISMEEAAKLGIVLFEGAFGGDSSNQKIIMQILDSKETLSVFRCKTEKEAWFGKINIRDQENPFAETRYSFLVDSITGQVIYADWRTGLCSPSDKAQLKDYNEAMRILSEKREAHREELKYSLNDVVRMSNPNTWTKIAKSFIRENGLNYDKSINSAEMISFSGERVEVMCLLDELQGETKKAGVVIDPVTEQVKIFTFIP